jgi:transcriptional regulator with XRE-family HTH domain
MLFSEWLYEQIETSGLSQAAFARRAGIAQSTVNDIVNGKRIAGEKVCNHIADALGI